MSGMGTLPRDARGLWTRPRQLTGVYTEIGRKIGRIRIYYMFNCHSLWSAMLSRALASVASPNSPGAGLFTVFNNPCTNPKISFSPLPALLSLSCEISDATNSDKQFAFRQCSLTTKLKYSSQMLLWQSKKNKRSKFSHMEKSIHSENLILSTFVIFLKL